MSRYHFDLTRINQPEKADFRAMVARMTIDGDHDVVHLNGNFVCDEVIFFETLRADAVRIAAILAPDMPAPQLLHTKKTTSRRTHPVADYYDAASIARIRQTAGWIFDRFDYPDRP